MPKSSHAETGPTCRRSVAKAMTRILADALTHLSALSAADKRAKKKRRKEIVHERA